MYGLDNESSDKDYLSIYLEHKDNRDSFMWEHHQLQYKQNNSDFNFVSLQSFIRNTLTGDSTINFEVIHSGVLENTDLNWLWKRKNNFVNYNIIKSYLGLAKRDLKFWMKDTNRGDKHTVDTNKKLSHFVRGVIYANSLLNNVFTMDLSTTNSYNNYFTDYEMLYNIKHGISENFFDKIVKYYTTLMNDVRDELNNKLNSRTIIFTMSVDHLSELDNRMKQFITEYSNNNHIESINYGDLFYETLEKGLTYN